MEKISPKQMYSKNLPSPSVCQHSEVFASREYIVTKNGTSSSQVYYLAAHLGTGEISSVEDDLPVGGHGLILEATPNPFNPRVSLKFELPTASRTRLEIFDLRGRRVADFGEYVGGGFKFHESKYRDWQ